MPTRREKISYIYKIQNLICGIVNKQKPRSPYTAKMRLRASSSFGRAAWTQGNEAFLQYRGFEVSSVYSSPTYILCYTKYSLRKQRG